MALATSFNETIRRHMGSTSALASEPVKDHAISTDSRRVAKPQLNSIRPTALDFVITEHQLPRLEIYRVLDKFDDKFKSEGNQSAGFQDITDLLKVLESLSKIYSNDPQKHHKELRHMVFILDRMNPEKMERGVLHEWIAVRLQVLLLYQPLC
jgi:hypothetical protein